MAQEILSKNLYAWATLQEAEENGWVRPCDAKEHLRPGLIIIDPDSFRDFGRVYYVVDMTRTKSGFRKYHLTSTTLWLYKECRFVPAFHVERLKQCRPLRHAAIAAQTAIVEELTSKLQAEIKKLEELTNQ